LSDVADAIVVLSSLYAAKKYSVGGLAHECVHFLQYNLVPENACQLLEQALLFDEQELAGRCRRHIEDSASVALASDGFCQLPENVVKEILSGNGLRIGEVGSFLCGSLSDRG